MRTARIAARLHVLGLALSDRMRRLRESSDRGSETIDKVLWIAFIVIIVGAVYAIFKMKILDKINSVEL